MLSLFSKMLKGAFLFYAFLLLVMLGMIAFFNILLAAI